MEFEHTHSWDEGLARSLLTLFGTLWRVFLPGGINKVAIMSL